jgi:hypothetical protein
MWNLVSYTKGRTYKYIEDYLGKVPKYLCQDTQMGRFPNSVLNSYHPNIPVDSTGCIFISWVCTVEYTLSLCSSYVVRSTASIPAIKSTLSSIKTRDWEI